MHFFALWNGKLENLGLFGKRRLNHYNLLGALTEVYPMCALIDAANYVGLHGRHPPIGMAPGLDERMARWRGAQERDERGGAACAEAETRCFMYLAGKGVSRADDGSTHRAWARIQAEPTPRLEQ